MARKPPTKKPRKTDDVKIRLSTEDKRRFEEAAQRRGLSLSAWLRMAAIDALGPQKP
jgi:hypothetical protein